MKLKPEWAVLKELSDPIQLPVQFIKGQSNFIHRDQATQQCLREPVTQLSGKPARRLQFWALNTRIEIALKLKGVEYEYIEQDLGNKSALLLQYNPVHKLIPVLVHKGKPIAECDVILEYIDETWKNNPILPQDPSERAMARFWVKFIDEKCVRALWKACWIPEKNRKEAMEEARGHLKTLENELKDRKFFGGEKIGMVDIVGSVVGFWVGCIQEASGVEIFTEEKFPILHKWKGEFLNCLFPSSCL